MVGKYWCHLMFLLFNTTIIWIHFQHIHCRAWHSYYHWNYFYWSVGGTIPATAQLVSSSYHAVSSHSFARSSSHVAAHSPSFAPSASHDDMHKTRSSSPLWVIGATTVPLHNLPALRNYLLNSHPTLWNMNVFSLLALFNGEYAFVNGNFFSWTDAICALFINFGYILMYS
jgi:hypothetical protein